MRSIEFLAPVEAMRGNLSGKQVLKYPTKNNSAWEAPSDKRSYATNYATRYIGAKKASNGRNYFAVKKRSAVVNSTAQRQAQALLGASRIIAEAMMADLTVRTTLLQMFQGYYNHGYNYNPAWIPEDIVQGSAEASVRKYLMRNIRDLTLIPKNGQFTVQPQTGGDIIYNNIWVFSQTSGTKVTGKTNELVKFFKQLHPGRPITFTVGGSVALGEVELTFDEIILNQPTSFSYGLNILGLTTETIGTTDYVKLGNMFLIDRTGAYITADAEPSDGDVYYISGIRPTA